MPICDIEFPPTVAAEVYIAPQSGRDQTSGFEGECNAALRERSDDCGSRNG